MAVTARLYRRGKWRQDEDGSESVVDVWEVRADSETETISNLLAASGLPAKGSSHAEKTAAICVNREMDHHDEVLNLWYFNATFSTRIETREDQPYASQRVKGGCKSGYIEVPAFYDSRGVPLVNSAGDVYEGLKRKVRTRVFPVTANMTSFPDYLFNLADTVNNANVTILGKTYPAGTCKLTDVDCPDEPSRDPNGALYWPVTFKVEMNPLGYSIQLPNMGLNELVYQKRTTTSDPWTDTTKADYDTISTANLKQIIKRRIQTSELQDVSNPIWLDANGQATRVVSFGTTQLGTGTITAGSTTLTLSTGTFDATAHKGSIVRVQGAGPLNGWLNTKINAVTGSTTATLNRAAFTTISTAKPVWVSGAIINEFILEDLADWSGVPLPNNQP